MKSLKIKNIVSSAAFLLGNFCLVACGDLGPEFLAQPLDVPPTVRLAETDSKFSARVVPQSYIVMFKTQNFKSNLFFSSFADEYAHHYSILNGEYETDTRIRDIDVLTSIEMNAERKVQWEPEFSAPQAIRSFSENFSEEVPDAGVLARVDFSSKVAGEEVLLQWEKDGKIWYAEPNEISDLAAGEFADFGKKYDNLELWQKVINLPAAFKTMAASVAEGKASESDIIANAPVIAVLDSGVDYEHPQLLGNIWENSAVGAAGCSDDLHGCNTTAPGKGTLGNGEVWPVLATGPNMRCTTEPLGKCDHGTHVAGLIAGKPNGSNMIGGVCPFCKIMILRVGEVEEGDTSGNPAIQDDSQIRAFKYLTRFRKSGGSAVRIVNASFGKYSRSRSLAILVDVLKKVGSGTLVIGAASNEDSMVRAYPAALANAIAVSSINPLSMSKSAFSNYGPWVDIAAPGDNLVSTLSGGSVGPNSGTSMAAPVVAGSAGLLLAVNPSLGFNQLRDRILNTASAIKLYGSDTEGSKLNGTYYYTKVSGEAARRPLLGGGVVDVDALIKGTANSATGQPLARVTPGCGVIGNHVKNNINLLLFLIVLPVIVAFLMRRGTHG